MGQNMPESRAKTKSFIKMKKVGQGDSIVCKLFALTWQLRFNSWHRI